MDHITEYLIRIEKQLAVLTSRLNEHCSQHKDRHRLLLFSISCAGFIAGLVVQYVAR